MQRPSITRIEFGRTLEIKGYTLNSRYPLIIIAPDRERIVLTGIQEWDIPPEDVEMILEAHGIDVSLFWEKNQTLY